MQENYPNFYSTIINTPLIRQYFDRYIPPTLWELTIKQLLIQAIQNRQNLNNSNNLQTIKNTRYLSPSNYKSLTPKVTQITPIQQPHFIYAKPKVNFNNLDNNIQQQISPQIRTNIRQLSNHQPSNQLKTKKYIKLQHQIKKNQQIKTIQQKKTNINNSHSKKLVDQTVQTYNVCYNIQNNQIKTKRSIQSNFNQKQSKINTKSQFNKNQYSQMSRVKHLEQNYKSIQSKIKDLVIKDKKQKNIQKKLQKHQKMLKDIQHKQFIIMRKCQSKRQVQQISSSSKTSFNSDLIIHYQNIRQKFQPKIKKKTYCVPQYNLKQSSSDSFSCSCSKTLNNQSSQQEIPKAVKKNAKYNN